MNTFIKNRSELNCKKRFSDSEFYNKLDNLLDEFLENINEIEDEEEIYFWGKEFIYKIEDLKNEDYFLD